jgi:hypothetical protein
VSKSGTSGTTLDEAKAINGSLHFLEMVIVALQERTRKGNSRHVPFRNSMLTSVLRDSLGGNCETSMVATCSAEERNTGESISTCRFAQRVAQVENVAQVRSYRRRANEERMKEERRTRERERKRGRKGGRGTGARTRAPLSSLLLSFLSLRVHFSPFFHLNFPFPMYCRSMRRLTRRCS